MASAIRLSGAVRLRPPSGLTQGRWVAEHLSRRIRLALSPAAAYVLLSCAEPRQTAQVVEEAEEAVAVSRQSLTRLVNDLLARGFLVAGEATEPAEALLNAWAAFGWRSAAEYHLVTYDYEFLDYREDGPAVDLARMASYRGERADTDRAKSYGDAALARVELPPPSAELLPASFARGLRSPAQLARLDWDTLARILSLTLGVTRHIPPRDPTAAAHNLRTSPSGGARHPTEGYVAVLDVAGCDAGWYHVAMDGPVLELLDRCVSEAEVADLCFAVMHRAPFKPAAVVILTSIFERNMYRYREPRTFRAVQMDVGHLITTLEVVARGLGIEVFAHYGLDEPALERRLGFDHFTEGVAIAAALGGGPG